MISAFDCDSYNKPGFDFGIAYSQGYRAGYIKLGGDNDGRYVGSSGPGYQGQFNRFCDAGFEHRGSYWVTGGDDPAGSARFYLAHRDPRTTFDVLDNESLDSGRKWSDAEACAFFDVLIAAGLKDLWQYGSRDSLWNTHAWPGLEARGIKAIVAIYNGTPFQNIYPDTYPAGLVKGHQFTSSASIGGLGAIDENAFADGAFTTGSTVLQDQGDVPMRYIHSANGRFGLILENAFKQYTQDGREKDTYIETATVASKLFNGIDVTDREYDVARQDALNREADYLAQMSGIASGIDPATLTATVKSAIDAALTPGSAESPDVATIVRTELSKLVLKAQ